MTNKEAIDILNNEFKLCPLDCDLSCNECVKIATGIAIKALKCIEEIKMVIALDTSTEYELILRKLLKHGFVELEGNEYIIDWSDEE